MIDKYIGNEGLIIDMCIGNEGSMKIYLTHSNKSANGDRGL